MNPVWHFVNGVPQIGALKITSSQVLVSAGSGAAPSYSFSTDPDTGIFSAGDGAMDFVANTALVARVSSSGEFVLGQTRSLSWGSSGLSTPDTSFSRRGAADIGTNSSISRVGANGQALSELQSLTELTTIAAAATTDTTIQMPAGAVVLAVSVRVTVVIPTAATFTVGDSGSAARFNNATVSTAANSTDPGTKAGAYYNANALSVRITPNATPGANTGRVRVTIWYYTSTPPTS